MYKILSESAEFCRRCDKNIYVCLPVRAPTAVHLQNANAKFQKVGVGRQYLGKGERVYNTDCVTNLSKTICTNFYQNRLSFVEDITKTFGCFFSVHNVNTTIVSIT